MSDWFECDLHPLAEVEDAGGAHHGAHTDGTDGDHAAGLSGLEGSELHDQWFASPFAPDHGGHGGHGPLFGGTGWEYWGNGVYYEKAPGGGYTGKSNGY